MLRKVLQLILLLLFISASVTIPTNQLFQNTLKRWGIRPLSDQDRTERWNRFMKAKDSVEQTTTDVLLESLNKFTVLNNKEFESMVRPLLRGYNMTEVLEDMSSWSPQTRTGRSNRGKRSLPKTFDYWEKEVGLSEPQDQASCGSCWSFPNVGTMEALNKHLTGDDTVLSKQYFVDCTFEYSGCAGGTVNEGYKVTMMRQYVMSEDDWPYTADYQTCTFADDIASYKNNALNKIWIQDWIPLGKNEDSMLRGLQTSPVAFGSYISDNIFAYSGGTYSDALCATNSLPHAMLLVGYTETTLRVKASYGAHFGDEGYINYKRGDGNLPSCRFYDNAYSLTATYRRDVEYEYCNDGKVATYEQCKASCQDMDTNGKTGWDLATIPTKMHNQIIMDKLAVDYPGSKKNDSFNYLWIGLVDENKDENYKWLDSFTPVSYFNMSNSNIGNKYGLINKNTGQWLTKNSLTFPARGLCSRPINCWNIENAIKDGTVKFSEADLSEGTEATIKCKEGQLVGANKLKCVGGQWDSDLPTCSIGGACTYSGEAGTKATIQPNKLDFENEEMITITCTNGTTTEHICTSGAFIPRIDECYDDNISNSVVVTLSIIVAVMSALRILI
ncbi:uncharacterized protein LOC134821236 [Bolinopsis microptera]|uniref:uncharacterized protein LOC134821236 n=1 Tax=Bolinopsis microptera TaxID=2820187 RepID=UPI00307A79DB